MMAATTFPPSQASLSSSSVALKLALAEIKTSEGKSLGVHIVQHIRAPPRGTLIDAAMMVRHALRRTPLPEELQDALRTWDDPDWEPRRRMIKPVDRFADEIRVCGNLLAEEDATKHKSFPRGLREKLLGTLITGQAGQAVMLFPVGNAPCVVPILCQTRPGFTIETVESYLNTSLQDFIHVDPSPTLNAGDITDCRNRFVVDPAATPAYGGRKALVAFGIVASDATPANVAFTEADAVAISKMQLAQEVAEALVAWFCDLWCDVNAFKYLVATDATLSQREDFAKQHAKYGVTIGFGNAIVNENKESKQALALEIGERLAKVLGVDCDGRYDAYMIFAENLSKVMRRASPIKAVVQGRGRLDPNSKMPWGALVNLYLCHGQQQLESKEYRHKISEDPEVMKDAVEHILSSVIPNGRWEISWGKELVGITLEEHSSQYSVVYVRPEVALRMGLHDLREVTRNRAIASGEDVEWNAEQLRCNGRSGKVGLTFAMAKWSPDEMQYLWERNVYRMWHHVPLLCPDDCSAIRSWSPLYAVHHEIHQREVATGGGVSQDFSRPHLHTCRVAIGQLSAKHADLLLDSVQIQELWKREATHVCREAAAALGSDTLWSQGRNSRLAAALTALDPDTAPNYWAQVQSLVLSSEPETEDADIIQVDSAHLLSLFEAAARVPHRVKVASSIRNLTALCGFTIEQTASYLKRNANESATKKAERVRRKLPPHKRQTSLPSKRRRWKQSKELQEDLAKLDEEDEEGEWEEEGSTTWAWEEEGVY